MLNATLIKLRKEAGLTQTELASKLGLTKDLYNKYERKGVRPSYETLITLADLYNVSIDYLLTGKESTKPAEPETPYLMEIYNSLSAISQDALLAYAKGLFFGENKITEREIDIKKIISKKSTIY